MTTKECNEKKYEEMVAAAEQFSRDGIKQKWTFSLTDEERKAAATQTKKEERK